MSDPGAPLFADDVVPILDGIGWDVERLHELTLIDLGTVFHRQMISTHVLKQGLFAQAGGEEVATRMIERASRLDAQQRGLLREKMNRTLDRGKQPTPRMVAAHIATCIMFEVALVDEMQRRIQRTN